MTRNRRIAEAALRPWTPCSRTATLQITHVFVDRDDISGVIDWSEARTWRCPVRPRQRTDAWQHEEHLGDVVTGYGTDVDLDVTCLWWSWRSLRAARWLIEHGFDPVLAEEPSSTY